MRGLNPVYDFKNKEKYEFEREKMDEKMRTLKSLYRYLFEHPLFAYHLLFNVYILLGQL